MSVKQLNDTRAPFIAMSPVVGVEFLEHHPQLGSELGEQGASCLHYSVVEL